MNRLTLRDDCTGEQRLAHEILDRSMSGQKVPAATITSALSILGDLP